MLAKKQIKTVMIPTTCGTGSEATCNAIVAVPEEQSKKGIVNDSIIPDYVVLDSNMIRKLPKSIVAATGVDALAHVVECFTSKKATPFSDTYAAAGAKLIFHNIREAYNNPDNMEAKSNMMTGAFYGGVAITGSGTTAVHALSYPLGGKYHIAHGVSNAILFCKAIGIENPKIGVAGLNPHCGENGLFGTEEIEEIQPAIDEAMAEGINIPEKNRHRLTAYSLRQSEAGMI